MGDRLSIEFYSPDFDPERFKEEFIIKRERFLSYMPCRTNSLTDLAIRAGFNSYLDYKLQLNIYRQLI